MLGHLVQLQGTIVLTHGVHGESVSGEWLCSGRNDLPSVFRVLLSVVHTLGAWRAISTGDGRILKAHSTFIGAFDMH